jgi:magnesium transporter
MLGLKKRASRPGTAPGTLQAPARRGTEGVSIEVIDYSAGHLEEKTVAAVDELRGYRGKSSVTWINVVGLHDVDLFYWLGEHFGIHSLALEDVLNVGQRPKQEDYANHDFIVMKQVDMGSAGLATEQISMFLGSDYVITVQEIPGDAFDPVRERIRRGRARIRGAGADYLAYALVDALIDRFFPVLERYGEHIEEIEEALLDNPGSELLNEIHAIKKDLLVLRRIAWPHREVIGGLERRETPLIHAETRVFLRDCYDHCVQIMDILETYRDLTGSMLDVYLSSVSLRMNEVMKVLTVMASIFIPLTFIAGVYGMNFDPKASRWNMPELDWAYGYPAFWAVIVVLGAAMIWFFRRKDWL